MLLNPPAINTRLTTNTVTHSTANITNTNSVVLATNSNRTWFLIQNTGSVTAYINLGSTATTSNSFMLLPNGTFTGTADLNFTGNINAITANNTTSLRIVEAVTT